MVWRHLTISLVVVVMATALLGVAYPLLITGLSQALFPFEANGSILTSHGLPAASALIGQPFNNPAYFLGRPSATSPSYGGCPSGGSNLGPMNPRYLRSVQERVRALRDADPGNRSRIPVDLVTASGSGLDPDISLAAAQFQVSRVARLRGIPEDSVRSLVKQCESNRQIGFLGEVRVNVLLLNFALDARPIEREER